MDERARTGRQETDAAPEMQADDAARDQAAPAHRPRLRAYRDNASWLYWLAGVSAFQVFLFHAFPNVYVPAGLRVVRLIYYHASWDWAKTVGDPQWKLLAFTLSAGIIGAFVLLGFLAVRRHVWALALGFLGCAADLLLLILNQDFVGNIYGIRILWIDIAFHVLVLGCLAIAFKRWFDLRRLERKNGDRH